MNLIDKYPIVSDQITKSELRYILDEFQKTLDQNTPGDVVELGCYVGTTALFLQRMLRDSKSGKQLYLYDSFQGLPAKTAPDASPAGEQFTAGELHATKAQVIRHFKQAGLPLPIITKAWFNQLSPSDMPQRVSFAFLDGDFYESVQDSLRLVWPLLAPGAVVIVDDYQSEALPGAKRAVDEWLATHPARFIVASSLAIIRV